MGEGVYNSQWGVGFIIASGGGGYNNLWGGYNSQWGKGFIIASGGRGL